MLQRKSNDCGIAAMAMLFKQPYSVIKAIVDGHQKAIGKPFDGMGCGLAMVIGKALGDPIRFLTADDKFKERLGGCPAVLGVPARDGSGDWHAIYWDGKAIHDPDGQHPYGKKGVRAFKKVLDAWVRQSDAKEFGL